MGTTYTASPTASPATPPTRRTCVRACSAVWRRGARSWSRGRKRAWLLACAANACKNRFRFLKRWQSLPLEAADVPGGNGREVLEAVLSLPEKYRAPVHLYYYEGYSQGEIADILGLRLTAVQTRMQRARAMLKEVLSDEITL